MMNGNVVSDREQFFHFLTIGSSYAVIAEKNDLEIVFPQNSPTMCETFLEDTPDI